jgi:hypothetical protein
MVAAEVVRQLPVGPHARRWAGLAAAALDLASGFCLKWSVFRAGTASAENPEDNRIASKPRGER